MPTYKKRREIFRLFLKQLGDSSEKKRNISANVRHIRSFSEAERKKNLGEKILLSLIYYKVQNF